ncbi:hypothetical protein KEM60_00980 [Austwickia sp. TVS 96-490-7B]|uniref:GNAT family N-acetyltransferase n=1 Tax=Austwickia sp. TVS 96-490-7B TaxID=2830843 RepID=UPI001C58F6C1|nr:GNAT family N-acetyltransferase [Austwickia sp. TVS 96-490-7B]MBW3084791.1 hypothetical protein [Austwickia sp. TVS 96-490-7B]
MTETTVRRLSEEDWPIYRDMRLRSLQESPDAFVRTYDEEKDYDEALWRARMLRAGRLIARRDGQDIGILSMRAGDPEVQDEAAEIFGLWVPQELRGQGVAVDLFSEAVKEAVAAGHRHLIYWVGTENARGVAFASGRGFRPSEHRRPMRAPGADAGEQEIAMVLSLS